MSLNGNYRARILLLTLAVLLSAQYISASDGGELRWGGDSEGGEPYVFPNPKNPREIMGFEVDLAGLLGRELNRRAVFVQNQWDGLVAGLERGSYDVVLNGLEVTEDRKRRINFSVPYYATYNQISVRAETDSINSMADLRGKTVGVLQNTPAQRLLERESGTRVRAYPGQINAYDDLANGRLDAVVMDWPIAIYCHKHYSRLKFVGQPSDLVQYAIGVRKEDTALLQQLNEALRKLIESGELRRVYEKWGIWNGETEKLFAADSASREALDDYQESVTRELTFKERVRQYIGYLPILLVQGAPMTLTISTLSMALAVALGLVLALMNLYGPRPLAWLARAYIEVIRGTPLLIQLYLIFYGLPNVGIRLSPLMAAVAGLGLNYAAYEAENYRAGIQAIPRGQMEAALSLGMTRAQALRHVILPQSLRLVIPPVTNDFIALFKDSSIVSVITMVELTKVYGQLASSNYDYIGIGILTAGIYFLLGLPFIKLARWAENHFAFDKRTPAAARRRWLGVGAKPAMD
ncbi:MAG TPA: ABC transporter substrate-binding protein/permease [Blastocatellia bacterium]|nr:ABC transporter substrate-binding protein/permease [Blastocatellia bacterium]